MFIRVCEKDIYAICDHFGFVQRATIFICDIYLSETNPKIYNLKRFNAKHVSNIKNHSQNIAKSIRWQL